MALQDNLKGTPKEREESRGDFITMSLTSMSTWEALRICSTVSAKLLESWTVARQKIYCSFFSTENACAKSFFHGWESLHPSFYPSRHWCIHMIKYPWPFYSIFYTCCTLNNKMGGGEGRGVSQFHSRHLHRYYSSPSCEHLYNAQAFLFISVHF